MQKRIFFSFWKVEKSNNPMHKTMCCETKGEAMSMRENEQREKKSTFAMSSVPEAAVGSAVPSRAISASILRRRSSRSWRR